MLLLAVIVSTQVFTVACDTRCGRSEVADATASPACPCMQSSGRGPAVVMPAMGSMCKDLLCKDDSASITNVYTVAPSATALMPVWVNVSAWAGDFAMRSPDAELRRSRLDHRMWAPVLDSLRI